jgi:O-antigen/teichoic acid export membrane protein
MRAGFTGPRTGSRARPSHGGLSSSRRSRPGADHDLTRKASLNTLASGLDYGARVLVGFATAPLLVAGLGEFLFGVWQILSRLIGYVSAASGRTPQALKWTIASRQESGDYEEKRRQVGSAVAVWLVFLPFLAAAGGALAWVGPSLLGAPAEVAGSVRVAIALLVVNLIAMSLTDIPRSVLGGENLGYKRIGLSTGLIVAGGGLTVMALYLGAGLPGVAAAQLATTLLSGAIFLKVARSYVAWFGAAWPSLEAGRRFFGLSSWFMVWRLVTQAMLATDIVVLGLLGRVELVTTYVLTKYAAETMLGGAAIVTGGIAPGLGGIIGSGALDRAIRVRNELMAMTWLMTTTVATTVLVFDRDFVRLWVTERYYAGLGETLVIVLMLTQFAFIRGDAQVIDLTLNVRRKVLLGVFSALFSLVLAATLVRVFDGGIVGVCLGLMAGRLVLSLTYPGLVGRLLGASLWSQLRGALRPAAVTSALLVAGLRLEPILEAHTWPHLVAGTVVTAVTVGIVSFYAGLTLEGRSRFLTRVRQLARARGTNAPIAS